MQDQKSIGVKLQKRKRIPNEGNGWNAKRMWNAKRRKWVHPFTQIGYIQPTIKEVFKDLTDEPSDSKDFKSAAKFVSRCLEKLEKGEFDLEENCCKSEYRVMGASPQKKPLKVRYALFDYFIDIRYSLKGRLPQYFLFSKTKQLYGECCFLRAEAGEELKKLKITRKVVLILLYFFEVSKQTTFYKSRSSKETNNSVFKKCLDFQVLAESKI